MSKAGSWGGGGGGRRKEGGFRTSSLPLSYLRSSCLFTPFLHLSVTAHLYENMQEWITLFWSARAPDWEGGL